MTTIPHRELRNQSSKILERVKNGETISVTNNGEVAATLIPPSTTPFEQLLRSGSIRPAATARVDFRKLQRVVSTTSTADLLADLRDDGRAVLAVTHDEPFADALADRRVAVALPSRPA